MGHVHDVAGDLCQPTRDLRPAIPEAGEALMDLSDAVTDDLRKRLHRVEGQIRGIEEMLEEGRDCKDLVTQLSAANKALEQVGFRLVSAGLAYCLTDPDKAEAEGYPLDQVEKMFLRLG